MSILPAILIELKNCKGLFRSTSGYINQLGFFFVLFLMNYSVECQMKSLSNLCVRFAMFPIFLAIMYVRIIRQTLKIVISILQSLPKPVDTNPKKRLIMYFFF